MTVLGFSPSLRQSARSRRRGQERRCERREKKKRKGRKRRKRRKEGKHTAYTYSQVNMRFRGRKFGYLVKVSQYSVLGAGVALKA